MRAVWAQRQEELSHSTRFSGKEYHCSSPASRREDLQGEAPVACRDGASVDFHPTLASVRGAALLGPQVVEVRQPRAPPLGAPLGVLAALPRQPLPFAGVRGLLPQGAGDGPRRGGAHRRPRAVFSCTQRRPRAPWAGPAVAATGAAGAPQDQASASCSSCCQSHRSGCRGPDTTAPAGGPPGDTPPSWRRWWRPGARGHAHRPSWAKRPGP
jgi:hypothetical protein